MRTRASILLIQLLAFAATAPVAHAQSFSFSFGGGASEDAEPVRDTPYPAKVDIRPAHPKPGQPYTLEVVVATSSRLASNTAPELKGPDGRPLDFLGSSFSFRSINGKNSSNTLLRFRGVAPEKPGEYRMPGTTLSLGRAKISVPETVFTVRAPAAGEHAYREAKLTVTTPPGPFFVGQEIPVRLRVENSEDERIVNITGISLANDGRFSVSQAQQLATADGESPEILVRLTPLSAGVTATKLTVGLIVQRTAEEEEQDSDGGPFGGMFMGDQNIVRRNASIPLPELDVRHTPEEGKPASYRGAVGSFTLAAPKISSETGRAGEPMKLSLIVRGDNVPERVVPPELTGDGWRVKEEDSAVGRDGAGRPAKQFNYSVTPVFGGDLKTPSGEFSWFDPKDKRYHTAAIPSLPVTVEGPAAPAPGDSAGAPANTPAKPGLAPDPAPDGRLVEYPGVIPSSAFLAVQGALLALFAGVAGFTARRRFLDTHPEIRRRGHARRALNRHGRAALRALARANAPAHADEVRLALRGALPAFVPSGESSLTGAETLAALPLAEATRRRLRIYFESEDASRYGGESTAAPNADAVEAFRDALRQLKGNLR